MLGAALASAAPRALAQGEAPAADVAALAGIWSGELEHRGKRTPIAVEIAPGRTGVLVAKLSLPAMNLFDAALDKARFENGQLRFASFAFDYDRAADRLRGTLPKAFVPVYALTTVLARTPARLQSARGDFVAPTREPLWRIDVGAPVWSDPAATDGVIFVGTDDGTLHALDAQSGAGRWRYRAGGPLRSGVTVHGDRLFVSSDDGVLHCLSVQDAKPHWQVRVNRAAAVRLPATDPKSKFDFHGAAVRLAGDTLFAGTHEGRVLALDARDGRARWSFSTGDRIVAAPGLTGGTLYVGSFDGRVYALDAANGTPRWTFDARAPVTSTPVRARDVVVAGSRAYDLWGLDATTGRERWNRYVWFSWIESSPCVVGRTAYVGSSDAARVFAFDAINGTSHWTTDVHGLAWGTPALDGDQLIVATRFESGPLGHRGEVLALDRATGAVRWHHPLQGRSDDATYGVAGSAVLAAGRAIVATVDGEVLAFATR